MRFTLALVHLFFAAFSISAYAADDVVAKFGAVELRKSQIKALTDSLDPLAKKRLLTDPAALGQLIRTETIRLSMLREALDKQWDKRPEVKTQIDRAREQAILTAYMNDLSRPPAGYPSESEIKDTYETNKSAFAVPPQYRIAQIFISTSGDKSSAGEDSRKKAQELSAKAAKSDFTELARQNSDHKESAANGGDMGWLAESDMIPELREQLLKMTTGQVSKPIQSTAGWHVIKLLDKKPASTQPLQEVKDAIASSLRLQKARQNEQQHLESALKSTPITLNEIAILDIMKEQ
jgi:peptidylprolyl isomerase